MTTLVRFRRWFAVLGLLALAVVALALGTAAYLSSQGQRVQLVVPQAASTSALFGDSGPGTLIGTPQNIIIRDSGAFLAGAAPDGSRYVSDTYLKAQGLYPLQVKTVQFVGSLVSLAALAAALVFGLLWWWSRRQRTVNPAAGQAPLKS